MDFFSKQRLDWKTGLTSSITRARARGDFCLSARPSVRSANQAWEDRRDTGYSSLYDNCETLSLDCTLYTVHCTFGHGWGMIVFNGSNTR